MMVGQINLFRSQALGQLPQAAASVTKDPAMLVWLDNRFNVDAHPNENYAREVMELFALGLGNYTEDDVKNAARAFTGWTLDKNGTFVFRPNQHDDGIKTFLGRTGASTAPTWSTSSCSSRSISASSARKLLEFFVYSDPEPELVEGLAQTYALSGLRPRQDRRRDPTFQRLLFVPRVSRASEESDRIRDRSAAPTSGQGGAAQTRSAGCSAWAKSRSLRPA